MTFLPIVDRELRVAARRRNTYWGRVGAASVPIAVAGFWLPVFANQFSISQGKLLFSVLSTLAFAYCLLAGARVTSDCLSAEKREGTIGLLFLTDLKGYDVVLGKFVSCSLSAFYGLFAIVPVLALALILGGVTLVEVGRMALLFLNTLFFSMAAGVFVSTLSRNDRRAMFATGCVILATAVVPYAAAVGQAVWLARSNRGPNSLWDLASVLEASPVFAFQILWDSVFTRSMLRAFYRSILLTHLWSWFLLGLASVIVTRVCRERPAGTRSLRWQSFRDRWSYGNPIKRRAFRARLLDTNAFYWLAARDRIKALYVWCFVGTLGLFWGWAGWTMDRFIFDWDISFWMLLAVFVFLKVWLTSEVCARLVEDRSNGAFELLLSSPLGLRELAHGQSLALRRQFGGPVVVALVLTYLLLQSALRSGHEGLGNGEVRLLFWTLMITLVVDLITLKWLGLWYAISSAQINRAILAACSRILMLPTVLFVVVYGIFVLLVQASALGQAMSWGSACALWLLIALATDLFFGLRARWQFFHQFRLLAAQRFAPSGPGLAPFVDILRGILRRLGWLRQMGPQVKERSLHWQRWLVAGCALVLVLPTIVLAVWRHSLSRRVEARLAAIQARGEPETFQALQDWGPVVLPEDNAGMFFQKAAIHLRATAFQRASMRGKKQVEWPGPVLPLTPELKANLNDLMARNRPALDLLHAGAKLAKCRYPVYVGNIAPQMVHWQALAPLRLAVESLEFEALLLAEGGDTHGAVEAIQTLLGLARAMAQEPVLAAQYNRVLFIKGAVAALERVLNEQPLSDEDLRVLSHDLGEALTATGPALARAFVGERCFIIDEARVPSRQAMGWGGSAPNALEKMAHDLVGFTARVSGIQDLSLLHSMDVLEGYITKCGQLGVNDAQALSSRGPLDGTAAASSPGDRSAAAQGYWESVRMDQGEMVARLRIARTALALEQFRAAHQAELPESLARLPLESPQDAPSDPFTSSLLHYQRFKTGYLLYSVGRDRRDNGGAEKPRTIRETGQKEYDLAFWVGITNQSRMFR